MTCVQIFYVFIFIERKNKLNEPCAMPPAHDQPALAAVADDLGPGAFKALAAAGRGFELIKVPGDPQDLLLKLGRQQPRPYRLQYHPTPITLATVAHIKAGWPRRADPPQLLAAPHIAPDAAQALAADGIPFVDAAGNAYFAGPGLFVRVVGREPLKDLPRPPAAPRLFAAKGMRVMFVLLALPDYLGRPQREIAATAQVAVGTVAGVFEGLRTLGYLREGAAPRLVRRPDLMTQWVNTYIQRKLYETRVENFRAADPEWWKAIDLKAYDACFGGDVAAAKLTGYLKPALCIVHTFGDATRLKRDARMRADPQGDILITDAFWRFPADQREDTAPPLLVYAELLATGDPRAIETAQLIHERFLAGPDGEA